MPFAKRFVKNFLDLLQSHKIAPTCLCCGSYFRQESFFCSLCFLELTEKFQNFESSTDKDDSLNVISQYRWVAKTSDSLSQAIHLLKLVESKPAWRFLAKLFSDEIKTHNVDFKNTVLVPVPGRRSSSIHTEYFSEVLSENLSIKRVKLLNNVTGLPQKELSRKERLSREFNFYVDFTRVGELDKIQNIVLIDDVVTTGATLQACKREIRALKPKANVSAWVMFRRL